MSGWWNWCCCGSSCEYGSLTMALLNGTGTAVTFFDLDKSDLSVVRTWPCPTLFYGGSSPSSFNIYKGAGLVVGWDDADGLWTIGPPWTKRTQCGDADVTEPDRTAAVYGTSADGYQTGTYDPTRAFAVSRDRFACCLSSSVKCFDAATGSPLWSVALPLPKVFGAAFGADGSVYVAGTVPDGTHAGIARLAAADGSLLWYGGLEDWHPSGTIKPNFLRPAVWADGSVAACGTGRGDDQPPNGMDTISGPNLAKEIACWDASGVMTGHYRGATFSVGGSTYYPLYFESNDLYVKPDQTSLYVPGLAVTNVGGTATFTNKIVTVSKSAGVSSADYGFAHGDPLHNASAFAQDPVTGDLYVAVGASAGTNGLFRYAADGTLLASNTSLTLFPGLQNLWCRPIAPTGWF